MRRDLVSFGLVSASFSVFGIGVQFGLAGILVGAGTAGVILAYRDFVRDRWARADAFRAYVRGMVP